jgi:hypothetical protein
MAASGRQEAATREIANTMRPVASTSQRTAAVMAEVAATTERSNVPSQTVSVALTDVGEVTSALRTEVGPFLHAMAQDDIYGRPYAGLPCNDAAATLNRIIGRCALACRITRQGPQCPPGLSQPGMTAKNQSSVVPNLDTPRRIGCVGAMCVSKLPAGVNRSGVIVRLDFFSTKDIALIVE